MGVWDGLAPEQIAPIKRACIRNRSSADLLSFVAEHTGRVALGFLLSNHVIRATFYKKAKEHETIDLIAGAAVTDIELGASPARVSFSSGRTIEAALAVGADGRFPDQGLHAPQADRDR